MLILLKALFQVHIFCFYNEQDPKSIFARFFSRSSKTILLNKKMMLSLELKSSVHIFEDVPSNREASSIDDGCIEDI